MQKDYKSSEKEREQLEEAVDKFRANLAKLEQTKKQLQHQVYITVMLAYFCIFHFWIKIRVMVLNATFNNISVISWLSVLLVKETGVHRENL